MQIDPAKRGHLPQVEPPTPFKCAVSNLEGWRAQLPRRFPLATPAVADGRLFLGGGFGSYEFYALDVATGEVVWQYQTNDDGPTAAVVFDEFVVFNTESCELEVLTLDGRSVWKRWLGDPLMSMPAVAGGCVFMAYPDSRGDGKHYLASFELGTGKPLWREPIAGEIITAPTVADDAVYVTTLDGVLYCFDQHGGPARWQEAARATSSPAVSGGRCFYSQREERPDADEPNGAVQTEHCSWREAMPGSSSQPFAGTSRRADYLHFEKRRSRSPRFKKSTVLDGAVGFGASKGDAKIDQAMKNLGLSHVSGVWSYQGSRPFVTDSRLYGSFGDTVKAVGLDHGGVVWERCLRDVSPDEELLDAFATPPCLANGKSFVGTTQGELYCLDAVSGEQLWKVQVNEPILFQPAVVNGRVFVPTETGALYCIETADADDAAWQMWGATPAHNGLGV